jgi:WD40 repeat protein
MDGHKSRNFAVVSDPTNPNLFLTGGWDNTVQFWDRRNVNSFRRIYGPFICGDALDLDTADSRILTGSWRNENALQTWDFGSGTKIMDIPADRSVSSKLYCAQWLGKDYMVAGGSTSNLARVVDKHVMNTAGYFGYLHQGVYCMDNDRSGPLPNIAVGTQEKIYVLGVLQRGAITGVV